MTMFGGPTTDQALAERLAALEARFNLLAETVDLNAQQAAGAIGGVADAREAGDQAALEAVNQAVAGAGRRTDEVEDQIGAEIIVRAQETKHLADRIDGLLGDVDDIADRAELARDQALAVGPIYDDPAAGNFATPNGQRFRAFLSSGSDKLGLFRAAGGGPVLEFTFPSAASVDDKIVSISLLDENSYLVGQGNNGGVLIYDSLSRPIGWSLPLGQNGNQSQVEARAVLPFALRGEEVRIRAVADLTGGSTLPLAGTIRAVLEDGSVFNVETTEEIENRRVGGQQIVDIKGVVPDTMVQLGMRVAANGGPTGTGSESIRLVSVDLIMTASGARRAGERTAEAARATELMLARRDKQVGPLWPHLIATGQLFGDATELLDEFGRRLGFSIPIGSNGVGSYLRTRFLVPPGIRARLCDQWIEFLFSGATSAGWTRQFSPTFQVVKETGEVADLITIKTGEWSRDGDRWFVRLMARMPSDPIEWMQPYIAQNSGAPATSVETFLLYDVQALVLADIANVATAGQLTEAWQGELQRALAVADVTVGRGLDDYRIAVQKFNGAEILYDALGRPVGWTIAQGQKGNVTLAQVFVPLGPDDQRALSNRRVQMRLRVKTSPGYAKNTNVLGQNIGADGVAQARSVAVSYNVAVGLDERAIVFEFDVNEGDRVLQPYFQNSNSAEAASDLFWRITAIDMRVCSADTTHAETLQWALSQTRRLAASKALQLADPNLNYPIVKTVELAGGDFTTIEAADASILDASAIDQALIKVGEGVFTPVADYHLSGFRVIAGKGKDKTRFELIQPDSATIADIRANSVFRADKGFIFRDATAFVENGRYPFHSDDKTLTDQTYIFIDARLEHGGNAGAEAYQLANGGNPADVWKSTHAFGSGTGSGTRMFAYRSEFIGGRAGVAVHNNGLFDKPFSYYLQDCTLVGRNDTADNSYSLYVQALGSFQPDVVELVGCTLDGDIRAFPDPWMPTTLDKQPADHVSEISIIGHGNSPAVFINNDFGRALRFDTVATTDGTTIALSGDAAPLLMGQESYTRAAAGGAGAYVYGWADVSGTGVGSNRNVFITSLGKRLGINRTLTVTVGPTAVDIVFSDMTNVSNASILATINAALSGVAVASLYNVGGRWRPKFTDEEQNLKNSSATLIRMGMVLAYDPDHRRVRAMTSADPATRYAGVAWEDIYPGETGRVKTDGYLPISDVLRSDSASFAFGDTFSIDPATPGHVIKGGSQGLLPAIRSDAVRVRS